MNIVFKKTGPAPDLTSNPDIAGDIQEYRDNLPTVKPIIKIGGEFDPEQTIKKASRWLRRFWEKVRS